MVTIIKKIQHVRQSDKDRNCGAACLSMLFRYYRKTGTMTEITDHISRTLDNGNKSCRTSLMIKYAESKGFLCCSVSVRNVRETIARCFENNIDVIVSYHPSQDTPWGHFSVVTGYDEDAVYVNDPAKDASEGANRKIAFAELEKLMAPGPDRREINRKNTVIMLADKKTDPELVELPSIVKISSPVYVFSCIFDEVLAYVDPNPEDGAWVQVSRVNEKASLASAAPSETGN